jgi:hypothetical protein
MKCPKCGDELEFTETVAKAMDYYVCNNCKEKGEDYNWWDFHKEKEK